MKKPIYIALGWLAFTLGVIGAFLPLLPTTPFILLAAYFFSKGSEKLYRWLIDLPRFGPVIKDWNENGTIDLKSKIICGITLIGVMIFLIFFRTYPTYLKVTLVLILSSAMTFVWTRPTTLEKNETASHNLSV